MPAIRFLSAMAFSTWPVSILAQPSVQFIGALPASVNAESGVAFAWKGSPASLQYRHRLVLPNGAFFGLRNRVWSDWDQTTSVNYRGFTLDGRYRFEVQARDKAGKTIALSHRFEVTLVPLEILEEATTIDWAWVDAAPSARQRYVRLAEAYDKAAAAWLQVYEAERRVLKASWEPSRLPALAQQLSGDKAIEHLLEASDRRTSIAFRRVANVGALYDILKSGGEAGWLVVRNVRTNRAAFSAIAAAWAAEGYRALAARADDAPLLRYRGTSQPVTYTIGDTVDNVTATAYGRVTTHTIITGRRQLVISPAGSRLHVQWTFPQYSAETVVDAGVMRDRQSSSEPPASTSFLMDERGTPIAGANGNEGLPVLPEGPATPGVSWTVRNTSSEVTFRVGSARSFAGQDAIELLFDAPLRAPDGGGNGSLSGSYWFARESTQLLGVTYRMEMTTAVAGAQGRTTMRGGFVIDR